MASWRNTCSFDRHPSRRTAWLSPDRSPSATLALGALLLLAGCGHAETSATGSSRATESVPTADTGDPSLQPARLDAAQALCRPADAGSLRARLQGTIDAELDWAAPATPQCVGGPRPAEDGVRLVYKGKAAEDPLLVIIGLATNANVTTARNVPASVTVVREGAGQFFATQGDGKCAFDEITQEPVDAAAGRYRLSGRGYCTQPARAVGGEGSVLVSRFDVVAVVEYPRNS